MRVSFIYNISHPKSLWRLEQRIWENTERGKKSDGEIAGCVWEWGFCRYVLYGHCKVLSLSVIQLRNLYA